VAGSLLATAFEKAGGKRLIIAADQAYLISSGDRASPLAQMLAACSTVLDQELTHVAASFVDLGDPGRDEPITIPDLPSHGIFAVRNHQLLGREIVPQPLSAVPPRQLRPGGTYLVSGAGGTIGKRLCRHLLDAFEATVIAIGRSEIDQTEFAPSSGGKLLRLVADVQDDDSIRSALAAAGVGAREVDGVFHLAGVTQEVDLVSRQDADDLERLAAARCRGMLALDRVFADEQPDFLVVFSSTASVLGGAGLYGYSASCALADGLAEHLANAGRNWLSLGWDGWATPRGKGQLALESTFFSEDEALALLDRLLVKGRAGHLLCMRGDPVVRAARARKSFGSGDHSIDATVKSEQGSQEPIIVEMAALWAQLMGRPVDPDQDFFRLGGDSLLAVKLSSAIRKRWNVRTPMSLFMEKATPRDLALYVESLLGRPAEGPVSVALVPSPAAGAMEPRLRDFNDALRHWAKLVMADVYDAIPSPGEVTPQHRRLFGYIQEIVEEDSSLADFGPARRQSERQAVEADLLDRAGNTVYASVFRGLFTLGWSFPEILRGEESGVYLMFEGEEESLANQAYRKLPEAAETLERMASLISAIAVPKDRPLRVLEIGAGLGVATERVLPILPPNTEYIFTDISQSFFPAIQQRFPQLRCEILDLDNPAPQLSVSNQKFDLILGSNALHCAASLPHSIERLTSMLAADGIVVLMETIQNEPWHLIAMGTLPGFLSCQDFRAAQAGPFATLAAWRKLWGHVGFELELSPDEARRAEELGQTAFIIHRSVGGLA
jgi:SAM-dependent methyltransferase/acyl carrier protein